mmetsp:Transcript_7544/g.27548  ORF Transcript_7544/g.27548 Transcript_7544/m.27548 type:complete len:222 (-) Transcript_7544:346-1011(-)|eukprot:31074-Pelagococcus_subviridis.AAC.22
MAASSIRRIGPSISFSFLSFWTTSASSPPNLTGSRYSGQTPNGDHGIRLNSYSSIAPIATCCAASASARACARSARPSSFNFLFSLSFSLGLPAGYPGLYPGMRDCALATARALNAVAKTKSRASSPSSLTYVLAYRRSTRYVEMSTRSASSSPRSSRMSRMKLGKRGCKRALRRISAAASKRPSLASRLATTRTRDFACFITAACFNISSCSRADFSQSS